MRVATRRAVCITPRDAALSVITRTLRPTSTVREAGPSICRKGRTVRRGSGRKNGVRAP